MTQNQLHQLNSKDLLSHYAYGTTNMGNRNTDIQYAVIENTVGG